MLLRTILLATFIAHATTFSLTATPRARHTVKPSAITARLGSLSGDVSRRLDLTRGRICETTAKGKQICRSWSFATNALGQYDDLELDLAEVEDLPSWYLIEAERSFREDQLVDHAEDASY
jgi:hypothetical protein